MYRYYLRLSERGLSLRMPGDQKKRLRTRKAIFKLKTTKQQNQNN
jgi:hypothetical protein